MAIASDRSSTYVQIRLELKAEACCPTIRIVQLAVTGTPRRPTDLQRSPSRAQHTLSPNRARRRALISSSPYVKGRRSKTTVCRACISLSYTFRSQPGPVNSVSSSQRARQLQHPLLVQLSALAALGQWIFAKNSTLAQPTSLRVSQFLP
jgi:hypothetical protein